MNKLHSLLAVAALLVAGNVFAMNIPTPTKKPVNKTHAHHNMVHNAFHALAAKIVTHNDVEVHMDESGKIVQAFDVADPKNPAAIDAANFGSIAIYENHADAFVTVKPAPQQSDKQPGQKPAPASSWNVGAKVKSLFTTPASFVNKPAKWIFKKAAGQFDAAGNTHKALKSPYLSGSITTAGLAALVYFGYTMTASTSSQEDDADTDLDAVTA